MQLILSRDKTTVFQVQSTFSTQLFFKVDTVLQNNKLKTKTLPYKHRKIYFIHYIHHYLQQKNGDFYTYRFINGKKNQKNCLQLLLFLQLVLHYNTSLIF